MKIVEENLLITSQKEKSSQPKKIIKTIKNFFEKSGLKPKTRISFFIFLMLISENIDLLLYYLIVNINASK